jgi:hypothetical protein
MQLMIDTLQESPAQLRLAAKFLADHAALVEAMTAGSTELVRAPAAPTPAPAAPVLAPVVPLVQPVATVTPIVPTAPPAPPVNPVASISSDTASPATTIAAVSNVVDEYDSAGMPWDARIHQKTKATKKDGTFKIQKGIDGAIVIAVTQELINAGRMRAAQPAAPVAVGAAAPVTLPPPPPAPQGESQTYNQAYEYQGQTVSGQVEAQAQTQSQTAPPPPPVNLPGVPAVHVPPAPSVGVPDVNQPGVLPPVDFRSLMNKIMAAKNAGKITAEQVLQYVQQAGAPSLQMLGSMAHLVPVVDASIDAHLMMT